MNKLKGSWTDFVLIGLATLLAILNHPSKKVWFIPGFLLVFLGLALWVTARYQLGQAFSLRPQAKFLVNRGVYAKLRHPIYVASIITTLGLCLMYQKSWLYIVWALLIAGQIIRARLEEKVLIQKFGDSYLNYKKHTWL